MELTIDAMRADLILRGYERIDMGQITVGYCEEVNDYGRYYRIISYDVLPASKAMQAYMTAADCTVTWSRYFANASPRRMRLDWDEPIAVEQEIYLPHLYRFVMELERCEHGTVVSPDGKRRASPMRCMNCGKLVY